MKYDDSDNQPIETSVEEANETTQSAGEEMGEVSQDFKDQVDSLLSGITPEQKAYVMQCLEGSPEQGEFDVEGLPE